MGSPIEAQGGFTPGPWWSTERAGYYEILANSPDCNWYGFKKAHAVAYADTEIEETEQEANARLIAASPDLLEAAQKALNFIANTESEIGDTLDSGDLLRAAIAKATGGAT